MCRRVEVGVVTSRDRDDVGENEGGRDGSKHDEESADQCREASPPTAPIGEVGASLRPRNSFGVCHAFEPVWGGAAGYGWPSVPVDRFGMVSVDGAAASIRRMTPSSESRSRWVRYRSA